MFLCAKAKRQQQVFLCAKAKRQQQDVGHEGVVTGRDAFSLRSIKVQSRVSVRLLFPLE
ncbi:hypothetical protein [Lysinibacillus sphaericus]|uniref:hypothetical protein n=1 Tax=Lysinibacillus sphaericus TaxID=1421 RepID=UPI003D034AB4